MDLSGIYKAFHTWVEESTGVDAYWDNPAAPRRTYPSVVMDLESSTPVGPDWHKIETIDGAEVDFVYGRRVLRLNLQAYSQELRPDADGLYFLNKAAAALRLPRFREDLAECSISLVEFQPAIEIDTELNGEYKSRWTQDFLFNVVISEQYSNDSASTIESTEVTNEGTDPDTVFTAP